MTQGIWEQMFPPLLTSFLATALLTPLFILIFKKIRLVDDPVLHKHPAILHNKPIPRGGGLPLLLGVLIAGIFFLPTGKVTTALFFASFLSLVVGVLDDWFDISPYIRFVVNLIAAAIVVGSGVGIPFITNPLGGVIHLDFLRWDIDFLGYHTVFVISDLIALLWIVWVMNMLNWSKGVDGQMPGVVAISAIVIGILTLRFSQADANVLLSSNLAFIIAGSALGFLLYNFSPAKIFPGYGATALYLLLGTVSIFSSAKLATAMLVMGIPLVDGIFTILRRILSGRSPFWHDKKHLHHLLLRMGLSQRNIALFYWIVSAILGAVALFLPSPGKLFALVMLIVLLGGILVLLHRLMKVYEKSSV